MQLWLSFCLTLAVADAEFDHRLNSICRRVVNDVAVRKANERSCEDSRADNRQQAQVRSESFVKSESFEEAWSGDCFVASSSRQEVGEEAEPGAEPVNLKTLALVDSACTRCMHSKAWRERFEHECLWPAGLEVELLDMPKRSFKSAFGEQRSGRQVKIPIGLGGKRGEVVSTEMDDCETPLLLSISAQEALDAVLYAKDRVWDLRALKVRVPLYKSGAHLAVRVDEWGAEEKRKRRERERGKSIRP